MKQSRRQPQDHKARGEFKSCEPLPIGPTNHLFNFGSALFMGISWSSV